MRDLWIIEKRDGGRLDLTHPQPEAFFGIGAIRGMTDDQIAKAVFWYHPDAVLTGDSIATWPAHLDPGFIARRKTW